ncbi:response regulator [Alloactinosynnema sp. L-07]|uniref:response regulator n=1 Tax=Alloactinosynnema sp. L-07 TaxID=1653480 RepID=UPI0012F8F15A|nr:response regulator [Alloactinosynnema sp. L-07]
MRVLLVEDHTQLARPIARELEHEHGHVVVSVRDPLEAEEELASSEFDVAVIDLLYEHLTYEFDTSRRAGNITLTGHAKLLVTGLYAARAFRRQRPDGGIVLWTSGEANRRLHLLFAYEDIDVRAFCSKSSGTGRADLLNETITAANNVVTKIDPVLNSYLPVAGSTHVSRLLLRDERHRAIWRAVALGYHTRDDIASVTGYASRTVGNTLPDMLHNLTIMDAGMRTSRRPINQLVSYASRNWEFFLDESVRISYP